MRFTRRNKGVLRADEHNPQVDGKHQKKKNRGEKEMDKRHKEFANPELAANLREYGENYGLEEDPYLEGLSNAIERGKNLSVWASNDVMALMPHPDVAAVEGPIYSALVLIRNVLVFVPVALTWLAVGKATTGFSLYTTKSSAASVVNFLQFWQNGYGVLSKSWTLSQIAEDDFYIIAAVIFLTFITPFMNRSAVKRATRFEQDALRERLALVIEVESFLFDRRRLSPMTIDSALAHSFERVVDATHNLVTASNAIKIGLDSLSRQMAVDEPPIQVDLEPQKTAAPIFNKHQTKIVENAAENLKSLQKRVRVVVRSLPRRAQARKELSKVELELLRTRAQLMELQQNIKKKEKKTQRQSEWKSAKREAERKKALAGPKNFDRTPLRLVEGE